jgi:ABC-type transport system, involved in lipoprotein release, permease component
VILMLYKNTLIKIKKSLGRYISLLVIVLVGVGFYAGVQITSPDITITADNYYKEHNLIDFKIVSSMGLTDDDVTALAELNEINDVIGSYSLDVQNATGAIRVHAIENNVNTVKLTEGKMPGADAECVADSREYNIGDKIKITDDIEEKLKNTEFTVVGLIDSVLYLSDDYGSTTIGNGKLSSFIYINKENFILDVYTEILVIGEMNSAVAYTKEYDNLSAILNDKLVKIKPDREIARYDEIYNEAWDIIAENEAELNDERVKAEKELSDAKKELDDNTKKLNDGKDELAKNEKELEDTVIDQNAEFDSAKQKIAEGWTAIDTALSSSGLTRDGIGQTIEFMEAMGYSENLEGLKQLKGSIDTLTEQEAQLNDGIATFNVEIEKAKKEIADAKTELADNEKKLNDGYDEYNEGLAEFNEEMADAELKISDAKAELADIEHPKWYISDRDVAVGYSELESCVQIVAIISTVFPLFFILISMLMTTNSMTRMITEERSELGILTSLGYTDNKIIFTYLLYVLSASGIGAVIGFYVGCRFLPPLIYDNFFFILPPLVLRYNMITFGIILLVTFSLMILVTILACNKELNQKPAALMRPLSPKFGQKILIERIGFIWKRLSFTWKVTIRNMFRYKKRAFMTILGVAGCASLLVVAFGLRDSMSGMAEKQYGDILRYSSMIILKDETPEINDELKELFDEEQIIDPLLVNQSAFKCTNDGRTIDFFIVVPENIELFNEYYNLTSTENNKTINLSDDSVIVTQRLAKVYKLKKGDVINIKDTENNEYSLTVSDIAENYMLNYVYMNPSMYDKVFDNVLSFNSVVSKNNEENINLADRLLESDLAVNVIFSSDALKSAVESTQQLSGVIILVVIVASILAIVVLYNLTAINISERTREIATLKVLGFYDVETNAYIYREALLLTVISIGIGMFLGVGLHSFVLGIIETGALSLPVKIEWLSYVLAFAITMIFSVLMQVITYFKLKKIDMIESLKSVE